jgi:hypothetical protein
MIGAEFLLGHDRDADQAINHFIREFFTVNCRLDWDTAG